MKYKVGDTVEITQSFNRHFGDTGTVVSIDVFDDHPYVVEFTNGDDDVYSMDHLKATPSSNLQVKLKPLTDSAVIPKYATEGSACFDLCADEDIIVSPGQTVAISTGLSFELPQGYQMKVLPRSGISLRTPLRVVIGIIDNDFRGEVKVILWNASEGGDILTDRYTHIDGTYEYKEPYECQCNSYKIRKGDRIAQCEVVPVTQVDFAIVDELSETQRGTGGFGSTGVCL